MILVTGATGHYGKATIDFLLKKGIPANNISALVRDEAKATDLKTKGVHLKIGDYENYSSLVAAFNGIDKLLLVSSNDILNRSQQQINAVEAAKKANVKHIIYTSFERKNESDTSPIVFVAASHINTEKHIKASGITYTILRNNLYMDFIPVFIGEKVLESGVYFPAGETKSAFALRSDMAEATANILTAKGHENKTYYFSNTENVSFRDVANTIASVSGKNIPYTSPEGEIYIDALSKAGIPKNYVEMFAGFGEAIKQGEFNTSKSDLENLLGRKPKSLNDYLTEVYSKN